MECGSGGRGSGWLSERCARSGPRIQPRGNGVQEEVDGLRDDRASVQGDSRRSGTPEGPGDAVLALEAIGRPLLAVRVELREAGEADAELGVNLLRGVESIGGVGLVEAAGGVRDARVRREANARASPIACLTRRSSPKSNPPKWAEAKLSALRSEI